MNPKAVPKRIELHATIKRADGRVENLGCIALHDSSIWRRMAWCVSRFFKRIRHG